MTLPPQGYRLEEEYTFIDLLRQKKITENTSTDIPSDVINIYMANGKDH